MEAHDSPMVPNGGFSRPEHQLEGLNSNSATAPKKRKPRSPNWSDEETEQLLNAYIEFEEPASTSKGRRRMGEPLKWEIISGSLNGRTAQECQRRMETLKKSIYRIKKYCDEHHKQFGQLSKDELKGLNLACYVKSNWYCRMCKIKEQPENALEVSSCDPWNRRNSSPPALAAVMVGLLSMASLFFSSLSVWFLSVICSPLKSRPGAKYGDNALINVC